MWRRVDAFIRRNQLIIPEHGVLLALSGGGDSMALLDVLAHLGKKHHWRLAAAFFDHASRDVSEALQVVQQACAARGVPLNVGRATGPLHGRGPEEAWRIARYDFLRSTAQQLGCARVALGHQYNDQAETVLGRMLLHGSGIALGGMQPFDGHWLIRPLLEERAETLRSYLKLRDVAFVEDPTNADVRLIRNRLRRQVMPQLRALNPQLDRRLVRLAEWLRADAEALEAMAQALGQAAVRTPTGWRVPHQIYAQAPLAVRARALRNWLQVLNAPEHCTTMARTLGLARSLERRSAGSWLAAGVRIQLDRAWLSMDVAAGASHAPAFDWLLQEGQTLRFPDGLISMRRASWPMPAPTSLQHYIPWQAGAQLLRVRSWRFGDRMQLPGLDGHKKVQDIFTDLKVPVPLRHRWPLVAMGERIEWLVGLRRAAPGPPLSMGQVGLVLEASFDGSAIGDWLSLHRGL